jgi:hypothetical protein
VPRKKDTVLRVFFRIGTYIVWSPLFFMFFLNPFETLFCSTFLYQVGYRNVFVLGEIFLTIKIGCTYVRMRDGIEKESLQDNAIHTLGPVCTNAVQVH